MKHAALLISIALINSAIAQTGEAEGESPISWTGFASVVAGRVFDADKKTPLPNAPQINCPCFISNWSYNGVYHDSWTAKPDTRAGLQANARISDTLSFVAQVVTRGAEQTPSVQWAFLNYQVDDRWQLQLGRKRVPLYFYSEFQDVGFALPWISPPTELYGWEVNNFWGGVVRYHNKFDGATVAASVFHGSEKVKDSKYNQNFSAIYGTASSDVSWKGILGGDLEVSRDWWTLRGIYLQSKNRTDLNNGSRINSTMKVAGLTFGGDFGDWFFLSELTRNDRTYTDGASFTVKAPAHLLGVGYRFGHWTPFVSVSQYKENTTVPLSSYSTQGWKAKSFVLRYDVDSRSSVKAQLNINDDIAPLNDFTGDMKLFRLSYDRMF